MAVKSFDPDNNPATAPPSLALSEVASEFGDPIRDSGAASNTGHKMSEFYRDGLYVPSNSPSTDPGVYVTESLRVPNTVLLAGSPPYDFPAGYPRDRYEDGRLRGVTYAPSQQGDPFYVRVLNANPSRAGWPNNCEVKFVWGTNIVINITGLGLGNQLITRPEYEGFIYSISLNQSFIPDYNATGAQYLYHPIMRKPATSVAEVNDGVPTSGPISFSQLYSSQQAITRTIAVPALEVNNLESQRGVEPDGSQGNLFGSGKRDGWPGIALGAPNAVLKRVSFNVGFNSKITVTASGGDVPVEIRGSRIENNGNMLSLSIRSPGWRVISPTGGVVLESTVPTITSIGTYSGGQNTSPLVTGDIPTATVDNLTEKGTYHLEFVAQVRNSQTVGPQPQLLSAGIYWKTPAFDIKVETT
jgi:hypothetical protein|tara:strand:+ start:43 stop:1284 length:1242 start_codon:yes stop_codon:yes gene_type:complete